METENSKLSTASSSAVCESKTVFTTAEAIEYGIPCKSAPPEPETCKFCGKTLYYEGIRVLGIIFIWDKMPQRCDCERARAYWEKADRKAAEEKERKKAEEEQEKRRQLFEWRFRRSKMRRRHREQTFETFEETAENRKARDFALTYVDQFEVYRQNGQGMFIGGGCGSGKTHLSAAIALSLMEKGYYVILESSIDILAAVKSAYDTRAYGEADGLEPYLQCDLLVIDDLGKEQCTPWAASMLYRLINYRYCEMKPTIITTNYDMEHLVDRLTPHGDSPSAAEAIISRIGESSIGVSMNFADRRRN